MLDTPPIRKYGLSFGFFSVAMVLVFYVRVTRGLDLSDEMQYYGQITGLLKSGEFFSNDLFIQQTVYLLTYPFFLLYQYFFDSVAIVFFGRLLMALFCFICFVYTYQKLVSLRFSAFSASVVAFCVTFAIPYHGIFALSYNTISQMLWIVFILNFYEWSARRYLLLSAVVVVMAIAHPVSSLSMALLLFGRLVYEQNWLIIKKSMLVCLILTIAMILSFLSFSSVELITQALSFSSGFSLGVSVFSNTKEIVRFLFIVTAFLIVAIWPRYVPKIVISWPVLLSSLAWIVVFFCLSGAGYSYKVTFVLSLTCILACCKIGHQVRDAASKERLLWLSISALAYLSTIVITSSNGLGQGTGAMMVLLPLYIAILIEQGRSMNDAASATPVQAINCALILLLLLSITHWMKSPYRDAPWWRSTHLLDSINEFRFIHTTPERAIFLQKIKTEFSDIGEGKKVLISTDYPAIYFVLGAAPETCMLYMHSLTSDRAEGALSNCLKNKRPDNFISINDAADTTVRRARLESLLFKLFSQRGFDCSSSQLSFGGTPEMHPKALDYIKCAG